MTAISRPKPTVLVLDDDAPVRSSLQFLLETHGFGVQAFQNAAALLDWPALRTAGCIVVDYKMPDLDGLEVTAKLRSSGVETPVILITGFSDKTIFAKAAAAGVQQVLLKPLIEDSLVARIMDVLPVGAWPTPAP